MPRYLHLIPIILGLLLGSLLSIRQAQAQTVITSDGTLGTTIHQNGTVHTISDGTIRGPNLFHSFDRFDVGANDTARFTGPQTGIENILNRITGGQQSVIDGTLQSTIPDANLYLLNPSGVMFGPNARLDVPGSFHVSTAELLRLGEDGTFHVSLAEQSRLSVSAPSAFGFLRDDPSDIRIQGSSLAVPEGQTLSIIGGDIEIVGGRKDKAPATLAAPSGQLHLVSVASPGETASQPSVAGPGVAVDGFARLGAITMTDAALIDVSGDGGGDVRIRGGQLNVDGSRIQANTEGGMSGGLIDVQVEVLTISSGGKLSVNTRNGSTSPGDEGVVSIVATDRIVLTGSNSRIEALTTGSGNAGQIGLRTGQLRLSGNSKITTEARGNSSGHAGQITIQADRIEMSGGDTRIRIATSSSGNAGTIHISAAYLRITHGSRIQGSAFTGSTGNAGEVVIVADTLIVEEKGRIISSLVSPGEGGSVDLTVRDLTVQSGGSVTSNVDLGKLKIGFESGDADRVVIRASGRVLVSGKESIISSSTSGTGNAGQVTIEAEQIIVTDRGEISTDTRTGGDAGQITLQADQVRVTDEGRIRSRSHKGASGNAGQIVLTARELTLSSNGRNGDFTIISTATGKKSRGHAGQITIQADRIEMSGSSKITTETGENSRGHAGQITIQADRIEMSGEKTRILSATRSRGNAGAIHISAAYLRITNGSRIQGSAFTGSTGNSGKVVIVADTLIVEEGGRIITSLVSPGKGGSVDLTVHDLTVQSGGQVTSNVDRGKRKLGFESGDAGQVVIRASGRVIVSGGESIISSLTKGTGNAGQVTIEADQLIVTDGGEISTETFTSGNGGNITLQANEITLANGGVISTRSTSQSDDAGAGGNIMVVAQRMVRMQDSEITTSVVSGEKSGGNIDLQSSVGLLERSDIRANAFGGPGGNITIQANGLITDVGSVVTASSEQSVDGTVSIQGLADLSGSLTPIDPNFASAATLISDQCTHRPQSEGTSRFTLAGRDRVPVEPNGVLPSPPTHGLSPVIGRTALYIPPSFLLQHPSKRCFKSQTQENPGWNDSPIKSRW